MIRAIVENEKQMVITSGLVAFVIDNNNTSIHLSNECEKHILQKNKSTLASTKSNCVKSLIKDAGLNTIYGLSRKERAAIRGFVYTENIEIGLPEEKDPMKSIVNFFIGRKSEQGEVLNIINKCKVYAKSLLCAFDKKMLHDADFLYEMVKENVYLKTYDYHKDEIEHLVIDFDGVLKNLGVVWEMEELGEEGNEYLHGDEQRWRNEQINILTATYKKTTISIEFHFNSEEYSKVELILK